MSGLSDELHDSSAGRSQLSDLRSRLGGLAELAGVEAPVNPSHAKSLPGSLQPHGTDDLEGTPRLAGERRSGTIAKPTLSENDFKAIANIIAKQKTVSWWTRSPVLISLAVLQLFESLGSDLHQDLSKIKRLQQFAQGTTPWNQQQLGIKPPGYTLSGSWLSAVTLKSSFNIVDTSITSLRSNP